jgi:biopolymer transport protein ExbD
MAAMNVVPLVIFVVTAPLLAHAVKIDLPKASSSVSISRPEHIELGPREVCGEKVAQVMALAAKAGLVRIGFVSGRYVRQ